MIYFINFGILLFFAVFIDLFVVKQFKSFEKNIFIALSVYLIFFAGFRIDTGYDYNAYKVIFNQISELNFLQLIQSNFFDWLEPGYIFLNYVCKLLPFEYFLFLSTVIAMVPKLTYIYKYSENKMLMLFFYYCLVMIGFDMGVLRQGIAMGFCLWGYQALQDNNLKKFVFIILLAVSFHAVSLLMLILLLFSNKEFSYKFYIFTIVIAFGISLIHPLKWLIKIMSIIGGNYIISKLNYYAYSYFMVGDTSQSIYLSVLKRLVILIFLIIVINKKNIIKANKSSFFIYFNAFYLSIIFSLLAIDIPIIAGRGTTIFQITQMFLLTELLNINYSRIKTKTVIGYKTMMFLLCVVWAFYTFYGAVQVEAYIPYMNYFF